MAAFRDGSLGDALQWASKYGVEKDHSFWNYYLGVWFAGRGEIQAAYRHLGYGRGRLELCFKGRMFRVVHQNFEGSREAFQKISSPAWSLHPEVFIERDITLSHFGASAFPEREEWFEKTDALQDDGLLERKAYFLFDKGDILGAKALLEQTQFEKVHQRYKRSELWGTHHESLKVRRSRFPKSGGRRFGCIRIL